MKHLVDIDEAALEAARLALGTRTIKDTVNTALSIAGQFDQRLLRLESALDRLAAVDLSDDERSAAWH
jgi:Arc/MetJ family transcription regulator